MAGLTLSGIRKSFGGVDVLRTIDLDILDGEFLTLLGPSGCGKSTLLRIIAGLESADDGSVRIGDRVVDRLPPKDRDVAMVFQTYALYPHLTVRANIALPLRMRRLNSAQRLPIVGRFMPGGGKELRAIESEVEAVAGTLGLTPYLERRPAQLSGGQRQRVALCRAMVRHPAIFLMDEPLSNLDAERRSAMRVELANLHRRLGATFVYVTHDQIEAMTLSTRIAVMDAGEIVQIGTPQEIYDHPADLRVAEFVGSPKINILDASIVAGALVVEGTMVGWVGHSDRAALKIGARPEHIHRVMPGAAGSLTAAVTTLEYLGSEVHVGCTLAERQTMTLRMPARDADALSVGRPLSVALDIEQMHLFAADGARLASRPASVALLSALP